MMYTFHFHGVDLDRKDLNGKSDPYLIMLGKPPAVAAAAHGKAGKKVKKDKAFKQGKAGKAGKGGKWTQVYKSEIIEKTLNPQWKPFNVDLMLLCGGKLDQEFLIEVYDYDPGSVGDLIGSLTTTIKQIQAGSPPLKLVNPKRLGLSNVAGTLKCLKCAPA